MAQPLNKNFRSKALGSVDRKNGEFWLDNPWEFERQEFNLSRFEHNQLFLNAGNLQFVNASHSSGADLTSDTRSVAVGDLNNDGMPDLVVRNVGGGPAYVFLNRFPRQNYLEVSLKGTESNAQGIGARLVCETSKGRIYRDLFPENTLHSQNPAQILFGLGQEKEVKLLTIRWPSGKVSELRNVPANQHLVVTEGQEVARAFGLSK